MSTKELIVQKITDILTSLDYIGNNPDIFDPKLLPASIENILKSQLNTYISQLNYKENEELFELIANYAPYINYDKIMEIFRNACKEGNLEIVKMILKRSDKKDIICDNHKFPDCHGIYYACANGHIKIIKYIISILVQIETTSNDSSNDSSNEDLSNDSSNYHVLTDLSMFFYGYRSACEYGHIEIVEFLINVAKCIDYGSTNVGSSTTIVSDSTNVGSTDNKSTVLKIIKCGGFINACRNNHIEILRLIIDATASSSLAGGATAESGLTKGATASSGLTKGAIPTESATADKSILEEINKYCNFEGYRYACEYGYVDVVKLLLNTIENAEEMNKERDFEGYREACKNGHVEVVELLLNTFKNTEEMNKACNFEGFKNACMNGHVEILELLLNTFKNAEEMNKSCDFEGFKNACKYGHVEIVKMLINISDDEMIINSNFKGFYLACDRYYLDIVELLVNRYGKLLLRMDINYHTDSYNNYTDTLKRVFNDIIQKIYKNKNKYQSKEQNEKYEKIVTILVDLYGKRIADENTIAIYGTNTNNYTEYMMKMDIKEKTKELEEKTEQLEDAKKEIKKLKRKLSEIEQIFTL